MEMQAIKPTRHAPAKQNVHVFLAHTRAVDRSHIAGNTGEDVLIWETYGTW